MLGRNKLRPPNAFLLFAIFLTFLVYITDPPVEVSLSCPHRLWKSFHSTLRLRFTMSSPPLMQCPRHHTTYCDITLMSTVKCPASFGQSQGTGVYKVTALPIGLEFLLKVAQRGLLAQVAHEI